MKTVRVVVGSGNQVKIRAVKAAFQPYYRVKVEGVEADSGIRRQPLNNETFMGARNRAYEASKTGDYDFAVGIEGGLQVWNHRKFAFAAIHMVSRDGFESTATTGWFPLPAEALALIEAGLELGEAMDHLSGLKETKRSLGAVGLLTRGVIDRARLYAHGVTLALIPHLNRSFTWS